MRTLLLTQVAPYPPDAGPKIKTFYTLRMLAQEHDIDLVTFARDSDEIEAAHELRQWCRSVTTIPLHRSRRREPFYAASGWLTGQPFLVARDGRSEMRAEIQRRLWTGSVDVVHADQISMGQYLEPAFSIGIPTVFDAHNAVWQLVRTLVNQQPTPAHRGAASIEWRMLRRFEGDLCRRADLTLTVTEQDRLALEGAAGRPIRSAVIPIGSEVRDLPVANASAPTARLLSVATMHYPPNAEAIRWLYEHVWPILRARNPELGFDIVGPRPPEDIRQWERADSGVTVHGYVDDLQPLFEGATVFVVPLLAGSGMRVKIIDAMARGVPVVSTTIGMEGLDLVPGEHLLVADTPAEFADAALRLAHSPELRCRIATAARQRALDLYDWRSCCRPVLDAYSQLPLLRHLAAAS